MNITDRALRSRAMRMPAPCLGPYCSPRVISRMLARNLPVFPSLHSVVPRFPHFINH